MMKSGYKYMIWMLVFAFLVVLAGCEEEQQSMSSGKARVVAAENIQLKKDLANKDAEIERQKQLLAKCDAEKEKLRQQLNANSKQLMETIMATMDKDSMDAKTENQKLQKEIAELKKQLAEK